jgi:hypothetical protein
LLSAETAKVDEDISHDKLILISNGVVMEQASVNPVFYLDLKVRREFERLLKDSPPHPLKSLQLRKLLLNDNSPFGAREIDGRISQFYSLPFERRTEKQAARLFKVRPYPWLMQQFLLDFSNACVSDTQMIKVAGRLCHQFCSVLTPPAEIATVGLMHSAVHRTTHPRTDQLSTGIDLEIFIARWETICFLRFGDRYQEFFEELKRLLARDLERGLQSALHSQKVIPKLANLIADTDLSGADLNLAQTDLDWLKLVIRALGRSECLPQYPLSRGPQNSTLLRLEQLVRAAQIRFPNRVPELEKVILRVCETCLKGFAQLSSSASKLD